MIRLINALNQSKKFSVYEVSIEKQQLHLKIVTQKHVYLDFYDKLMISLAQSIKNSSQKSQVLPDNDVYNSKQHDKHS